MSSEPANLDEALLYYANTGQLPPNYSTSVFDSDTSPIPRTTIVSRTKIATTPKPRSQDGSLPAYANQPACLYCQKHFASQATLDHHLAKLGNHKTVTCGHCEQIFENNSSFRAHQKREGRCKWTIYMCQFCNAKFASPILLNAHSFKCPPDENL